MYRQDSKYPRIERSLPAALAKPFGNPENAPAALAPPRFLAFGIPFTVFYGTGAAFVLIAANIMSLEKEFERAIPMIVYAGVLIAAYVVVAGALCTFRKVAGIWMGLGPVFLSLLSQIAELVLIDDAPVATVVGLGVNVALVVLAVVDLRRHFTYKAEVAHQALLSKLAARPSPPKVDYDRPYRNQAVARRTQFVSNLASDDPAAKRETVLSILLLAASIEPELAFVRLERARSIATKLLGEENFAATQQQLSVAVDFIDPHSRLAELGPQLGNNAQLRESLRQCLEFILREAEAFSVAGAQFLENFDIATDGTVEA